ncbi:MAG: phosphate acyltransferase [Spirochaetota bacterium]
MNSFDMYTGGGKQLFNGELTVAVAGAEHTETLLTVKEMQERWNVHVLLFGKREAIVHTAREAGITFEPSSITDCSDALESSMAAVEAVVQQKASVLIKGSVHTSEFAHACLNKQAGLRIPGKLMLHLALFEVPFYHKPLFLTDSAVNINPDVETKIRIIARACEVMSSLGVSHQKVALLAPVEEVNSKIQSTLDAEAIVLRNQEGCCPETTIGGPFAFDAIVSRRSAQVKGITSSVAGDADLILCPNLDTGNAVNKLLTLFPNSRSAGIVVGLKAPVVLTSRSDSVATRLNSVGMAMAVAAGENDFSQQ